MSIGWASIFAVTALQNIETLNSIWFFATFDMLQNYKTVANSARVDLLDYQPFRKIYTIEDYLWTDY